MRVHGTDIGRDSAQKIDGLYYLAGANSNWGYSVYMIQSLGNLGYPTYRMKVPHCHSPMIQSLGNLGYPAYGMKGSHFQSPMTLCHGIQAFSF